MVNKKNFEIVSVLRHQTSFLVNLSAEYENDLTFSWLATIFAVQKCLIFGRKHFFIYFLYI